MTLSRIHQKSLKSRNTRDNHSKGKLRDIIAFELTKNQPNMMRMISKSILMLHDISSRTGNEKKQLFLSILHSEIDRIDNEAKRISARAFTDEFASDIIDSLVQFGKSDVLMRKNCCFILK